MNENSNTQSVSFLPIKETRELLWIYWTTCTVIRSYTCNQSSKWKFEFTDANENMDMEKFFVKLFTKMQMHIPIWRFCMRLLWSVPVLLLTAKEGSLHLKSTCDVNLLSKLSIIFKEWRVMNNVDRGGVIVLFIL